MSRKRFEDMNCAAAQALDRIGDWWTLLIVREAMYGTENFSDFQSRLGIARNILTERLASLVENGILERVPRAPDSPRHVYRLTDKGHDLLPVLVALMQWGDRWVFGKGQEPLRITDAGSRKPIRRLVVAAEDGRPLRVDDLKIRPGPGAAPATRRRFETGGRD